jgi:signal transduction histidine kinase/HAMP domain-containing protein
MILLGFAAIASVLAWRLDLRLIEHEMEHQAVESSKLRVAHLQDRFERLLRQGDWDGIRFEVSGLERKKNMSAVLVLDEHNRVLVAAPNAADPSGDIIVAALPKDIRRQHVARMEEVRSTMQSTVVLSSDRLMLVSYAPLLVNGGMLLYTVDLRATKASAFGAAGRQALEYALLFGGIAAGASLIIHLSLTRRVARLVAVTKQLASGDLNARTEISGNNELALVARAFDAMAARISVDIRGREQAERELRRTISLLQATIESTADGLLIVDVGGRIVTYNKRFAGMWRVPATLLDQQNGKAVLAHTLRQLRTTDVFQRKLRALLADRDAESCDVIELNGGRVFEHYSRPQRIDGLVVGRIWSFRDVSARRDAEAALDRLNKDLIDTSRRAGMAEIATNVLHNVGNVLNSVNVSASLIIEGMRQSKTAGLIKVVDLLRMHEHDLATFITSDACGKHLPAYLARFAEHLQAEGVESLKELHSLRNNIEHIKDIVTMQQRYATTSGVAQIVEVISLVEDSIRMSVDSPSGDDVRIVREFSEVPNIMVDKHRMLQVLVNLVRNAKYACRESSRPDKRLTVHVATANDRLTISVSDNGVGIPPENLTRIFDHGFTTRKEGHGFGLHSGALTALELGGSLRAHSDGVGKGATFALDLPLNISELAHA